MANSFHEHLRIVVVFLLALLVSTDFRPIARADDKLIEAECHNAEVQTLCVQCIKSDPGATKADRLGIAIIVVGCLNKHSKSLQVNMSVLADHARDRNLKAAFQDCSNGYSKANKDCGKVVSYLKSDSYDSAASWIGKALDFQIACQQNISMADGEEQVPINVVYEMNVYDKLSEAANRIIDRLGSK